MIQAPSLAAKFFTEGGQIQFLSPLLLHSFAKLSFASLKRDYFSLRRFHEIVVRRLDQLSGHVMHPVLGPRATIPK